ncbi:MAG: hypothetical protein JSV88_30675 [Candidatus Aminicenantes bacterium]|nr:MAG: hypothetical protein JSV88_30675 [Candidatus Aminicenantes bacterium]
MGIDSFISSYNKSLINHEELAFLEYLFFDCLDIERASETYEIFSDQLTFLNYKLWKCYFDQTVRDSFVFLIF